MTDDSKWKKNIDLPETPSTEELLEDFEKDRFDRPSYQNQGESSYRAARDHAEFLGFEEVERTVENWNMPVGTTVFQGWSGFLVLDQSTFSDSVRIRYADDATAYRQKKDKGILDYNIEKEGIYGKKGSGSDEVTADRIELEGVELDKTAEDAVEARNYVSQAYDADRGYDEEAISDLLAELDDFVRS